MKKMLIPDNLLYSDSHEWVSLDGDIATIGITDFAQGELGDVIYFEFPELGRKVSEGEPFGTVEAVKTVADLISPFSGTVVEVNESLNDSPEIVNRDPYNDGWIVKIELSNPAQPHNLLSPESYQKLFG